MIKNIVFDIGNVCVDFCYKDYIEGLGYDSEMCEKIAKATVEGPVWELGDSGHYSEQDLLDLFLGNSPELEKEIRHFYKNFDGIIKEREATIPWIMELKEKGYGVYYLSNYPSKIERECKEDMKFLSYMDGGLLSYRERMVKPNAEFYRLLCQRYGLKESECLFIDDRLENVEGAKAVGMEAVLYTTKEEVDLEISKLIN